MRVPLQASFSIVAVMHKRDTEMLICTSNQTQCCYRSILHCPRRQLISSETTTGRHNKPRRSLAVAGMQTLRPTKTLCKKTADTVDGTSDTYSTVAKGRHLHQPGSSPLEGGGGTDKRPLHISHFRIDAVAGSHMRKRTKAPLSAFIGDQRRLAVPNVTIHPSTAVPNRGIRRRPPAPGLGIVGVK